MALRSTKKGQSIIELAVGLIALIPIVLVLFDLAVIVIGVQVNDSTCREAARVAASGPPSQATQRATAVVNRANAKIQGMLSNFVLVSVTNTPASLVADAQALIDTKYGGPINGQVTVRTQVDVRPFVVQVVYNGTSPLKFVSQQTFPYTYVVPNTMQ